MFTRHNITTFVCLIGSAWALYLAGARGVEAVVGWFLAAAAGLVFSNGMHSVLSDEEMDKLTSRR